MSCHNQHHLISYVLFIFLYKPSDYQSSSIWRSSEQLDSLRSRKTAGDMKELWIEKTRNRNEVSSSSQLIARRGLKLVASLTDRRLSICSWCRSGARGVSTWAVAGADRKTLIIIMKNKFRSKLAVLSRSRKNTGRASHYYFGPRPTSERANKEGHRGNNKKEKEQQQQWMKRDHCGTCCVQLAK